MLRDKKYSSKQRCQGDNETVVRIYKDLEEDNVINSVFGWREILYIVS